MKTKLWAIGLVIICTLFTSTAQIMLKFAADSLVFEPLLLLTNWWLWGGVIGYGLGALLLLFALKGGEVVTLYPILTTSYVWVTLSSGYFFNEIIGMGRWIGVTLIVTGIIFVAYQKKEIIEKELDEKDKITVLSGNISETTIKSPGEVV
jgi:drug/metabolite transporter (DMT)-like permease